MTTIQMTLQEILERIKTLTGYSLFKVMKDASTKNHEIFLACFERAKEIVKELTGEVLTWEQAKAKFETMTFPNWKIEDKTQNIRVGGFPCEINQVVDGTLNIKSQNMVLMNHRENTCVFKSFISKSGVNFL